MLRDSLYVDILSRLNGRLDGDLFEEYACAFLQGDFPTLVPIRGGGDSGMDGATADQGPFLVCTTHSDVIGNLTKNLKSYLNSGGKRREIVLATSRPLNKTKRTNLEKKACKLGFRLIHIYDQAAFADSLYRDPPWCKELLGLTTRPSALSVIPRTERPLLDQKLVGREADALWLQQSAGDRLLIGQPGCGKTFLLRHLVMQGWGLFLVDTDKTAIADAIRSQSPQVIIVDDAHENPRLLSDLCQLRREIGADFSIVATSWQGDAEEVAKALCLTDSQVRGLGLLTRDEIVEVIKHAGLVEPVPLVREIVNQAEGRPGLAVTLAFLCLNGDASQVFFGESLSRSIGATFQRLVGPEVNEVLAVFSLGGDRGMSLAVVADFLGMPLGRLRSLMVKLAAGGVLREDRQGNLSIWPESLRYILVRDTFFGKLCNLPYEDLILKVPSRSEMALSMIEAKRRGALIPNLLDVLESINAPAAWQRYTSLGEQEAIYVLENHPSLVMNIGQITLHAAPEITLPLLLSQAIGDERTLHNTLDHPLRWVQEWIKEAMPGSGEGVRRRRILLDSLTSWFSLGGDERVVMRALCFVLSPVFGDAQADPGSGMRVTLRSALLMPDEIGELQGMWPRIRTLFESFHSPDWEQLTYLIRPWAYPELGRISGVPEEVKRMMRSFAALMLRDLAALSRERPGVQHWLCTLAHNLGIEIETHIDPEFEVLFPEIDRANWEESEERQKADALILAASWSNREPGEVAARLVSLDSEAQAIGKRWPCWIGPLCQEIADVTTAPEKWLEAIFKAGASADAVAPFLRKIITNQSPGWESIARLCLEQPAYEFAAVSALLPLPEIPEDLIGCVLEIATGHPDWIESICRTRQVPDRTLILLLRHQNTYVSTAAATGEWVIHTRTGTRPEIDSEWREAVVRAEHPHHFLTAILKSDSTLAYEWLRARLQRKADLIAIGMWETVDAAVDTFSHAQRDSILDYLDPRFEGAMLAAKLVGNNPVLYKAFLDRKHLAKIHLAPLDGHPTKGWVEKAIMALDAGYTPKQVAVAAFQWNPPMTESESAMWHEWVCEFEELSSHVDPRMNEVAEIGRSIAFEREQNAVHEERLEAIYGL